MSSRLSASVPPVRGETPAPSDAAAAAPTGAGSAARVGRPPALSFALAFTAIYLIWGSTYLGIRIAIESMPPFLMASGRFLIAGGLLFAFLWLRGARLPTWTEWRTNAIIGTFLLLGGNGLVVWAAQVIPSGVIALIIGIGPLFMVLTEWAWPGGSRPSATTMLALLLGFAGVAWLAAPWENGSNGGLNPAGVLAILAACLFWSLGSIYSRHAKQASDPFFAAAQQMIGGGLALLVVAIVHGDLPQLDPAAITGRSWTAFAYLIFAGSLVGFSTFVWLMKHSTPARVATYAYVNPVVAVFLGWLILHEPITSRTLVACTVIVVAVAIITTEKARKAAPPR
jgi:drug/metabolite transporter (DMT)-like permease